MMAVHFLQRPLLLQLGALLVTTILCIPTILAADNIRLSTYCSTHNNCPPNSECDMVNNYCMCFSGFSPPDRKLDSCQPTSVFSKLYDARFGYLEATCRSRLNCPPNSYCDPAGLCTCYPGWVTLDRERCVFEEWGTVPDGDARWRSTTTPCRSSANCMENAECTSSNCMCTEGYVAAAIIGDGYFKECHTSGARSTQLSTSAIIMLGSLALGAIAMNLM